MKKLFPIFAALLLLSACAPGGLSGAEQTAAVQTAVANLLGNQAATDAAQVVPTQEQATSAPVAQVAGEENFTYPPEAGCIPVGTEHLVGTVLDIWGADEIGVEVNGEKLDIVYIGIDTTGISQDTNSQLTLGKKVLLIRDVTDVNQYGQRPRYVITEDGLFVNYELLKRGAAFLSIEPPDAACERTFDSVVP